MIRLCIFDLDGTLVDSLKDLANAMNTALEAQGFGTHDIQKYRFLVGSGLSVLADRAALAPNERYTPEVKEKILALFMQKIIILIDLVMLLQITNLEKAKEEDVHIAVLL